jgi:putative heme-binding domain-containing protein
MSWTVYLQCAAALAVTQFACLGLADEKPKPFGIDQRVAWTTSKIFGTPDPPLPLLTERAFSNLSFKNPVDLMSVPGTDRMLVVELGGPLRTFQTQSDVSDTVLAADVGEIPDAKKVGNALKVYGFAFHPDFERNHQCFICYVLKADDPHGSRVSRFQATSIDPLRIDLSSEEILITWLAGGHNGGSLQFGPEDGYLYISTGDGSPAFPPDIHDTGQDIGDLLASVLRINVDRPDGDRLYSVPADNPFVTTAGARGEVWTYGHRNPWRMSFDSVTGDLWIGDVGWEMWEMIYRATPGANFGWSLLEHSQPIRRDATRGPTPVTPPVAAHSHTESRSITGGHVYRGKRFPELVGTYIYGDYVTGKIWGLAAESTSPEPRELADTTLQIICFGVDRNQSLYIVAYDGTMHRLVKNPTADVASQFPRSLSETGLFASTADHQLAPGVIPYEINAQPWADGTTASRFIALPGTTRLGVHKKSNAQKGNIAGEWSYPDGTVIGKTIYLPVAPGVLQRLETQILHRNGDQWQAYCYIWSDKQDDAVLSNGDAVDRAFTIQDANAEDGMRQQTWHFASRTECILCHTTRRGSVYGFRVPQLNRDVDYGSLTDNQLRTLSHIGLFEEPLIEGHAVDTPPVKPLPRTPNPMDRQLSLEERARSYLHVNCATCHCRGGGGSASIELLESLSLERTRLFSRPTQGTFGIVDPWILAPGDPYRSILYYRMCKLGRGRMPHLGSQMVDVDGVQLIRDWILDMTKTETGSKDLAHLDASARLWQQMLSAERDVSPADRQTAVDGLLSSANGAIRLATVLSQRGSTSISPQARQLAVRRGSQHPDAVIRDLFESFIPEQMRTKRLGSTIDPRSILTREANLDRGRQLFVESQNMQCRNCHRVAGRGKSVGPDLDHIGTRLSPQEILTSILDPSRRVDAKFQTWLAQTESGELISGLLVEKSADVVVLRDLSGKDIRIRRDEIELLVAQKKSLMPDLLLRDCTAQDAADLLAYLTSLK